MPELETRFAELPDWLKSNNPPAPSWLQRQENARRNQEEQRRNLALELDRRRTEQDLKKAAFELTVEDQNREMELRGDEALAKIAPAMGNYFQEGDVIGAGNYLLSEASRNPTITRSKQFNQYLNMLGTSFGAKVMQDRMNQMAAQVEAANQSRILSDRENQARMAELRARVAEQGSSKSPDDIAKASFVQQMTTLRSELVTARSIPDPVERAREMARIRKDVSDLTRKYNRVIGIEDMALEDPGAFAEPRPLTKAEELLKTKQENLDVARMNGETAGHFDANGAFNSDFKISPWSKSLDELQKEIDEQRKLIGGGAAPQSTPSGGVILKRSDIFKK